jgi:IS30 family transposase
VEPGADREQASVDFPEDASMRISHEAIYQALYVQGRGALGRELTACLRTGRALRVQRARTRGRGKKFVSPEVMMSERPAEVADRAVAGHWEGDLILGLGSSAIGTLVERTSRFTMLLHLPRLDGHGDGVRVKNGLRWPGTVRRRFATRSPRRSRRCPSSCAGR